MEESHYNVPFGYLSVLLSSLCINDQVRAQVRKRLPGQTLKPLLEAVEEFVEFHRKVDHQLKQIEGQEIPQLDFVNRLEVMMTRLRRAEFI